MYQGMIWMGQWNGPVTPEHGLAGVSYVLA